MKTGLSLFYVTTSSVKEAEDLAHSLLAENLIACANILPLMTSVYRWEGRTAKGNEAVLLLKSKSSFAKRIEKHILKHHSYSVPCVLELPIQFVAEKYGKWLKNEVRSAKSRLATRHDRRVGQGRRRKKKPVKR